MRLIINILLLRPLLGWPVLVHYNKLALLDLTNWDLRLFIFIFDALALVQLDQRLLRRIRPFSPEVFAVLSGLVPRLKGWLGAITLLSLTMIFVVFLIGVEWLSALIGLNPVFLVTLQLLQLLLEMLVHLRLVHILDFFDHEVGNGCRTPVRIVVIINVYIVIIAMLKSFIYLRDID